MLNVCVWGILVAKYLLAISLSKLEASRIISCAILWGQASAIFLPRVFPEQIRDLAGIHIGGFFLWFLFSFGFWWVGLGWFGGILEGFFCLFFGVCWLLGS